MPQRPDSAAEMRNSGIKKGGHPARPDCQVSPACGGYDIRQTETRNPMLLLMKTSVDG